MLDTRLGLFDQLVKLFDQLVKLFDQLVKRLTNWSNNQLVKLKQSIGQTQGRSAA